ncbi:hypothetical protein A5880_002935 [Enterococcus sp. 4G2_DIV0659]|uniref:Transposase n=1 Tax=Candidatus Enterococcus mansonii TaxID=1834181 RepID=A0A242CIS4_9ENTE|nr:hypothetical protein A5880_000830 [Enterococcus sp. 4G2_DIV0659]
MSIAVYSKKSTMLIVILAYVEHHKQEIWVRKELKK